MIVPDDVKPGCWVHGIIAGTVIAGVQLAPTDGS